MESRKITSGKDYVDTRIRLQYWQEIFNYHYGEIFDHSKNCHLSEERLSAENYAILIQHWWDDMRAIRRKAQSESTLADEEIKFLEMARYFFNVKYDIDLPGIFPEIITEETVDLYRQPVDFFAEREMAQPDDILLDSESIRNKFSLYTTEALKVLRRERRS